jgi:creatinine amidohydrolase
MRPWILAETNYAHVKDNPYEVAVLPLGATEPHNLHLPYGTDMLEGTIVGEKICQAAHEKGARVVLLPTIPYGTETNMHAFPLAMNLDPSTLNQVVTDLVASLVGSNIRKIVLLNSHGGNELKPLLRQLCNKTEARLFLCN